MSQQALDQRSSCQPEHGGGRAGDNENKPRAKRTACMLCRKRKLRCDGGRPKCFTCNRYSHECEYSEVRKKSGPKRGYVKALEARLQQAETLLLTQYYPDQSHVGSEHAKTVAAVCVQPGYSIPVTVSALIDAKLPPLPKTVPALGVDSLPWAMLALSLEEPLPIQSEMMELHQLYFENVHRSMPMIHWPRYLAAMNLEPNVRSPMCLRCIICSIAAYNSPKYMYSSMPAEFYRRAREYAELDEMNDDGESVTLAHCQTWILIAWYEFRYLHFQRFWQSTGRALGLALMMGLNQIDNASPDINKWLPPPKDWTETEERRRTFWCCFGLDRYGSLATGSALRLDERDISTILPSPEEAFEKNQPVAAPSLEQALSSSSVTNVSAFTSVILMGYLLGRNITCLRRPGRLHNEEILNGAFWQEHRRLESILSSISLTLHYHPRLQTTLLDTNIVFMNILLHTTVICHHQAFMFKGNWNDLPQKMVSGSRARCVMGAMEITRILKMVKYTDLIVLNLVLAFSSYVAARVFTQYLKWRPENQSIISSLEYLGSAMRKLSRKSPLMESFMAQLDMDLEGTGIILSCRTSLWNQLVVYDVPTLRRKALEMSISQLSRSSTSYAWKTQINLNGDTPYDCSLIFDPLHFQLSSQANSSPFNSTTTLIEQLGTESLDLDFSPVIGAKHQKLSSISDEDGGSQVSLTRRSQGDEQHPQHPQHPSDSTSKNSLLMVENESVIATQGLAQAVIPTEAMFLEVSDAEFSNFLPSQLLTTPISASDANITAGW